MTVEVSTAPGTLLARRLGIAGYEDTVAKMRELVAGIHEGHETEQAWFLEHPAMYSAGTSARAEDLQQPDRFPTYFAGRGGQWTYHGPGQRVVYLMLNLDRAHGIVPARDIHAYVEGLESWLISALGTLGIMGERRSGRVGIWVADPTTGDESKIAALGIRVTRWVSWHGVSINVDPDLSHFAGIVPCGIREHGVTSLRALGLPATMADMDRALADAWPEIFGSRLSPAPGP